MDSYQDVFIFADTLRLNFATLLCYFIVSKHLFIVLLSQLHVVFYISTIIILVLFDLKFKNYSIMWLFTVFFSNV